jgi:glyoxylase-like metal-dependent hydrolase (beta-lactamase superfamily II)
MENGELMISAETLRTWLEERKPVFILDVRPMEQREEWQIPGSHYIDAYQKLKTGDMSAMDDVNIPEDTPVVTVCEAGRTSLIAARELMKRGVEVYSLEGGMKAWSLAWNEAELKNEDLKIIQVRRTGKGCLSYILGSEEQALVIDPSVDPEVYLKIAKANSWQIKIVIDTHIHADHLSRSRELVRMTNSDLFLPEQDKVNFAFHKISNDDTLKVGTSILRAISTPGHTLESMTYILDEEYLFTGDTLFTDSVGRPDLKADLDSTKARARLLYRSLQKLLTLSGGTIVLPGHTSKPIEFDGKVIQRSLKEIKASVEMLKLNEEEFIDRVLQGIPATPPNYVSIIEKNLRGDYSDINPVDLEAGANRCAIA